SHYSIIFYFSLLRRPPRSTLFPTRRSSDLTTASTYGYKVAFHFPTGDTLRSTETTVACDSVLDGTHYPIITAPACDLANESADVDRKSTRLNSSHVSISYAVFCLKKKKKNK